MKAKFKGENGWGGLTQGEIYILDTREADGFFWVHRVGRKLTYPYSSLETFKKDWSIIK